MIRQSMPSYIHVARIESALQKGSKVLYIKPTSLSFLQHLQDNLNIDLIVLDRNHKNISAYTKHNIAVINGVVEEGLGHLVNEGFDYVICDNIIQNTLNPEYILQQCMNCAKYSIVTITNFATIKNRIRFLLYGSYHKDISSWYKAPIRNCSIKEFTTMCIKNNILIERATCYDSDNNSYSLYDASKFPSFFAESVMFVLSNNSNNINALTVAI